MSGVFVWALALALAVSNDGNPLGLIQVWAQIKSSASEEDDHES